jgi:UDP-N-acetylglucosamine--N-acetylmuramyl-(pentapeptide) pyrophosphoryl-undecaprenol N-acetylglucosamine transferase
VRIAFAGGGTGGHLYPGLAVAEILRRGGKAETIVFFGAVRGIEVRAVPRAGYELVAQHLEGVRGSRVAATLRSLSLLSSAVFRARAELQRREIDVVVGLGGYASSAAVIAAWTSRIPIVLLEQNRDPGLANRLLGRLATAVCTSFDDTEGLVASKSRVRFTGNPVRPELEEAFESRPKTRDALLVFGGSAGAASVNRGVLQAVAALKRDRRVVLPERIIHQAGSQGIAEVRAGYEALGIRAEVHEFIEDMASAYAAARLAICRAGATTVAELAATATPAILIPFPHAAAHQAANAAALETAGAALVCVDGADTASTLAAAVERLLADPATLDSVGEAAGRLCRPGAAARVADVITDVAAMSQKT